MRFQRNNCDVNVNVAIVVAVAVSLVWLVCKLAAFKMSSLHWSKRKNISNRDFDLMGKAIYLGHLPFACHRQKRCEQLNIKRNTYPTWIQGGKFEFVFPVGNSYCCSCLQFRITISNGILICALSVPKCCNKCGKGKGEGRYQTDINHIVYGPRDIYWSIKNSIWLDVACVEAKAAADRVRLIQRIYASKVWESERGRDREKESACRCVGVRVCVWLVCRVHKRQQQRKTEFSENAKNESFSFLARVCVKWRL